MEDKFVAYPVVITHETNNEYYQYLVFLPDFGTYCQANSVLEALRVAYKFIVDYSLTRELPPMKLELPQVSSQQIATFVNVDIRK
ncbi:MAG TPA: hypothetical protein H9803_05650 [Candidatus Ligilactobacillus excrementavium]|nr:hypothetical protein [Candidatus Ligilactobacillus excrementavium]